MILAGALHGLDYCDFQPPHLSFLRRPHLPDFQLGPKRILANSYLHEVLTLNGYRHTL